MRPSVVGLGLAVPTLLLAACGPEPSGPEPSAEAAPLVQTVTAARAGFGSITIALDLRANRTTDIAYTTVGRKLHGFSLDDDSSPTLPSSRTFAKLKPGTYSVQQAAVAGVALTDIVCSSSPNGGSGTDNNTVDLASRSVTIRLERDETVACTFEANQPIWEEGDFVTWTQGDWGDEPSEHAAALLVEVDFVEAYPGGTVEVGIPGIAGFSMTFDNAGVLAYLPAPGAPGRLTFDLFNPTSSSSGSFGGDVVALELNTDFAVADFLPGGAGFGNLTLCNVSDIPTTTVNQFLATANTILGGASSTLDLPRVAATAGRLNASFLAGEPSEWAQDHLVSGACP